MPPDVTSDCFSPPLRILIVAENCSLRGGGEAALAFHYFRLLRARGAEVFLVTHCRCRAELLTAWPDERERLYFSADHWLQRGLHVLGRRLPDRLFRATFGIVSLMLSQWRQRKIIREMVARRGIDVVHQPTPVSPAQPSLIFDVGAPVVIGPLNGGMNYPAGFRDRENRWERAAANWGRRLRHLVNAAIPGKRKAALILAANARSRRMLPRGLRGEVALLVENGVDLAVWKKPPPRRRTEPVQFAFLGRLVEWKGVDLLLAAWARLPRGLNVHLNLIGDGPLRAALADQCARLGVEANIAFLGWLDQRACWEQLCRTDVLVLPALMECGGACVLEAMAAETAVIAAAWGGPIDYLDPSCGILIPPVSREQFVADLAQAIQTLGADPARCAALGAAGRAKVLAEFDWERKIDAMLAHFHRVVGRAPTSPLPFPAPTPRVVAPAFEEVGR